VSGPAGLTRARILELLHALAAELGKQGIVGELYLVGGAVMCLALEQRPSTKDVDAFFAPITKIRQAARKVGIGFGVGEDWLNDAVKGYLSPEGSYDPFLDLDSLRVFVARPEYLLAMKCLSMRLGPEFHDEDDVRFLLRYLNIERYEQAVELITRYYPLERFPQKTLYALEEILPS
jgi:hypothetical protein